MKNNSIISIVLHAAVAFILQNMLNNFFYREMALKSSRLKLIGKALVINLKELSQPLILLFSEQQVNVVNQLPTAADCVIKTALVTLVQLKDKQELSVLINNGKIVIEGNIQIIHYWSALLDAAQWNLGYYLAPYIGDVLAEGTDRWIKKRLIRINSLLDQQKKYFKDVLVEEWRVSPNMFEVISFAYEVKQVVADIAKLEQRLAKLEKKI